MTTSTYDPFKLVQPKTLPPIPEDGKCQHCLVNELQYRWKMEKYVCGYCFTRLDDEKYMTYTDEQLDELRAKTMKQYNKEIVKPRVMGDLG